MEFFADIAQWKIFIPFTYLFDSVQRIWIPYLLTSYLLAFFLNAVEIRKERAAAARSGEPPRERPSLIARVFPKNVFFHRSAIVDYFYFYSNTVIYAFLTAPSVFSLSKFSLLTFTSLEFLFGPGQGSASVSYEVQVLYAFMLVVAMDFGMFLAHWLLHLSPFLWNFHKVHHSAEVLTPITVYRVHPIDDMFSYLLSGIFIGICEGAFRYFFSSGISMAVAGGVNIFLFIFYVGFYNLRHSHIWCSYGQFWSKIFISPAQHQIHHSVDRPHWNKNYGFIFAFWDLAFGSLYVPKEQEKIQFGIGDGSEEQYSNFLLLYWIPFRDAFRMTMKKLARLRRG